MALLEIADNTKINVDIVANAAPVDTLFIHGNLASNTWWEPTAALLRERAQSDFRGRLILAEWRGCGRSPAPRSEADLHPSHLADDNLALLERLGVTRAALVAHSTGGLIALYMLLKRPELFTSAVLLDPVNATGVQFAPPMYDAFTQMSRDRAFCASVMLATIHGADPANALVQRLIDDAFGVAPAIWHGIPNVLKDINITEQLARITQPVLVMHGEQDPILPKEGSRLLASQLQHGRYLEIAGHGHSLNVEDPALFVRHIQDFFMERNPA